MSLFGRRKKPEEVFDPHPGETNEMPARPYKVLHADLAFYSDPECHVEVSGARLLVLQCEDPRQQHKVVECIPTMRIYSQGQTVVWELNNKAVWDSAWYTNPETNRKEKAWARAVEFAGKIVRT